MIGVEDARFTYEFTDHFRILPMINERHLNSEMIASGKLVSDFSYSSEMNTSWMTKKELLQWVATNQKLDRENLKLIPYGKQSVDEADLQEVVRVLRSSNLTQGAAVPSFEARLEEFTGSKHAVVANSATSCLHMAMLALGVGKGDFVWTSPITFVASANAAKYCGANVDFIDIDVETGNISISALAQKLGQAQSTDSLPKVVVPVHFAGQPCDMEAIHKLSKKFGFAIIEDASHAIGAVTEVNTIGDCRFSDICIFSFHPVKIITTAEGGVALTNDANLAGRLASYRSHGITKNGDEFVKQENVGLPWYYEQHRLGYNFRMTDLQAALGASQLSKISEFLKRRRQIASQYKRHINHHTVCLMNHSVAHSAWHLFVVKLDFETIGKSRQIVIEQLKNLGIGTQVHYIPVHTQPFYQNLGFSEGDFPNAEKYYSEALSIPMYPSMTDEEVNHVVMGLFEDDKYMNIALGSAQFGSPYGVLNNGSCPKTSQIADILDLALQSGVTNIDTAYDYGSAELKLGEIGVEQFQVITKVHVQVDQNSQVSDIYEKIEISLERLKLNSLAAVLLHSVDPLKGHQGDAITRQLEAVVEKKLAEKVGVSVYGPEEIQLASEFNLLNVVQAPFSAFDRRVLQSGWVENLKINGNELWLRSIFLQGLLLIEDFQTAPSLSEFTNFFESWGSWCDARNLSKLSACLLCVRNLIENPNLIIGVENRHQLSQIIEAISSLPSQSDVFELVENTPTKLIDPRLW